MIRVVSSWRITANAREYCAVGRTDGTALGLVMADNTLVDMRSRPCPHCGDRGQLQDPIGGLCAHSLIYRSGKDAHQPNLRVELLGNQLTNTNGIQVMSSNCGANSTLQVANWLPPPRAPLTQGFVVRRNVLLAASEGRGGGGGGLPFAPALALFGVNRSRFYWDFTATSKGCATETCADNGINVIGCVRGGVVEGNQVPAPGYGRSYVELNATNGSVLVYGGSNSPLLE
eukprot:SAG11_NODE_1354_length_5128_cov_3.183337_5_plen_230_part_00